MWRFRRPGGSTSNTAARPTARPAWKYKGRSEHQRAERELTLGETEARHEVAQRYRKEAESACGDVKRLEKARADLDKRREQIEQRMQQS